ncbi:helix-turn-helix transcriptional regulator [Veillonellaceae bacterium WCA-693-APC-5D-A]|uniref:Helix-turn-helix transcriptional regulator n=1 Tax=Anaerovibrio slackiae TaxID=2652309 RepID=A0A6I2UKB5_9FIRM|nr:helix-turn-helix transcriptional regulator [Anaerovibrio slackiae]MSU10000.1 helix-turn-helix transcriptional regulator [Anaerovibrio slackiae]
MVSSTENLKQIFSKRLKTTRKSLKIKQQEMADSAGITLRGYQYYEAAVQEPSMSNLYALAEHLGVSLDYLVGRTNKPEVNK